MTSTLAERVPGLFRKLDKDLVKLSSKQTAASVHNFRTGARRLQTLFEQLLPERERNTRKLLKALTRLRKRAGKVRDLDVQLAALRSLKVSQEPRRKTQLMHALIELRAENEKKLRSALTKQEVSEIRKRLRRARKEIKMESLRDPLKSAEAMLAQLAHSVSPISEEALHQHRIITKRARYVVEFAATSPQSEALIAQLKQAQDSLGDWHDWLTLTHTAAHRLGDVHQSPLVAVLHNLTAAKFRKAADVVSAINSTDSSTGRSAKSSVRKAVPQNPDRASMATSAISAA